MNQVSFVEMGKTIPKVIFQTFPDKHNLPDIFQDNIRQIRQLNPEWEYRLFDDRDIEAFILQAYGEDILRLYLRIDPVYGAARADFFRYLLMYSEGGVYLDIKSTLDKPLDTVLIPDYKFILSQWNQGDHSEYKGWGNHCDFFMDEEYEFQQWHIITVKGHPFLKSVISKVIQRMLAYDVLQEGVGKKAVLKITGPIVYTQAIEPLLESQPYHRLCVTDDLGIGYSIFRSKKHKTEHSSHRPFFKTYYAYQQVPLIRSDSIWGHLKERRFYMRKKYQKWKRKLFRYLNLAAE